MPVSLPTPQRLLAWNPFKAVRPEPAPLLEMLVSWQQPLAGNTCPANASSPLQGCPAGYYCSYEAARAPCPPGFFCPVSRSQEFNLLFYCIYTACI